METTTFSSGRGFTDCLRLDADREARKVGAVEIGTFRLGAQGVRSPYIMHHYFNKQGLEVAHYSPSMETLLVFNAPRTWWDGFKEALSFKPLIDA